MKLGRLNRLQRYGMILTGAAWIALLAIHNPSAGYTTSFPRYELWPLPIAAVAGPEVADSSCTPPVYAQQDTLASQKKYLGQELGRCRLVSLRVMEWRSNGALSPHASTIRHILLLSGALLVGGLAWLWLFRDPPPLATGAAPHTAKRRG
jgi:hypothetical protein